MQGPAACAVASLLASPEGRHRLTAPLPPVLVACGGAAPRGPALPQPEPLARRPPLPPLRQREAAWSVVLVTSPPLQPCPVNHPLAARPAPDAGLSVWPQVRCAAAATLQLRHGRAANQRWRVARAGPEHVN